LYRWKHTIIFSFVNFERRQRYNCFLISNESDKIYLPLIKTLNRNTNYSNLYNLTLNENDYKKIVDDWLEKVEKELKKYSYDLEIKEKE